MLDFDRYDVAITLELDQPTYRLYYTGRQRHERMLFESRHEIACVICKEACLSNRNVLTHVKPTFRRTYGLIRSKIHFSNLPLQIEVFHTTSSRAYLRIDHLKCKSINAKQYAWLVTHLHGHIYMLTTMTRASKKYVLELESIERYQPKPEIQVREE